MMTDSGEKQPLNMMVTLVKEQMPISIGICSLTRVTIILSGCFSPESVIISRFSVS